jgi:dienelactone hydrolase
MDPRFPLSRPAASDRRWASDDALEDFTRRTIGLLDVEKVVYVAGEGPAVIVLAEMPGISPHVARFARWVRDAGFTVYLPSLFGRDGAFPEAGEGLQIFRRACIQAEFRAFESNASAPVTVWLRALARLAHGECGGPGVGALGMCFTGNFALSMTLEPAVVAPVLCQPSLPLGDLSAIQIAPTEVAEIRARFEREDLTVLGYRFEGDRFCPAGRFASYQQALGKRFVANVLPSESAHPAPPPFFAEVVGCPHSVVTAHLIDADGEPTRGARDEIIAFLRRRLQTG